MNQTMQIMSKKSLNLKTEVWGRGKGSRVSERDYALRPGHARARAQRSVSARI